MKQLTTALCCIAFMIAGAFLALKDFKSLKSNTIMAQPPPLAWNTNGVLPLDLQLDLEKKLDLDKKLSAESPINVRDSVVIRDSIVVKTKWKTRYKTVPNRTEAREVGTHLAPVTPDSLPNPPTTNSTLVREEQTSEDANTTKVPAIQLTVDGQVVYSSENDIHSAEGGQ